MTTFMLVVAATIAQGSNSGFTDGPPTVIRGRPPARAPLPFRRDEVAVKPPDNAANLAGFHEYHQQISELFKREAQAAKDPAARAAVVRDLCSLHGEIVSDPRYATSDTLKQYRTRLWSKLNRLKAEYKRQLAREGDQQDALADVAALEQADPLAVATADSLMQSLSLLDQTQGGPGMLLAHGGRAVGPDHGRELVELIERTINPAFWDVNGGPGAIVYYRPLMCLVVRATTEVHGRVGGVVGGLREAGR
jgi:hypothetical protein